MQLCFGIAAPEKVAFLAIWLLASFDGEYGLSLALSSDSSAKVFSMFFTHLCL